MSSDPDYHIFRDGRRQVSAAELVQPLGDALVSLSPRSSTDELLAVLLRAGELECALSDVGASPEDCERAARLTDLIAVVALQDDSRQGLAYWQDPAPTALSLIDELSYSGMVTVGVPEGFAYYAVHPLDYADHIAKCNERWASVFIVGVRSIGTTLSAVVAAGLRQMGLPVERTTVRPTGHPYERQCVFSDAQLNLITAASSRGSEFIVCDEGPGRSGSSLLSVAEALERAGVARSHIVLLCSHEPDVHTLCATDAVRRWSRLRSIHAGPTKRLPADGFRSAASGEWRRSLLSAEQELPACWPQFERLTYFSLDGRTVLIFEGYGQFGQRLSERNRKLSDAGFGLPYLGHEAGFGRHQRIEGRAGRPQDLTSPLLARMAEYCAWRAREFAAMDAEPSELETMARVNFEREFGFEPSDLSLPLVRPAICDNQMMPHAWLNATSGAWLKLDAAARGDDHFFPGPCDIAWDLAGIAVEWSLSEEDRCFLLARYRACSGEDASDRLAAYEMAYTTFRMAWSRMAAASVGIPAENTNLIRDYQRYRSRLADTLAKLQPQYAQTQ